MKVRLDPLRPRPAATVAVLCAIFLVGCAAQAPAPIRHSTVPPPATAVSAPGQQVHTVRPGDTLMGIGRLYGQNVNDLVVWNNLMDPNQLRVGQEIRVSPPGGAAPEPIAIVQPVEVRPIAAPDGMQDAPVMHEPRGGRQPYSDQAWAAIRPDAAGAPAAAPAELPREPQPPVAVPGAAWLWPASGPIVLGYNERIDNETVNKGIDIGGNPGDPVLASAAGQVAYSGGGLRGYGNLIIIKHDEDYLTAYAHNQKLLVQEGDQVRKGQQIAELGSTDADRPKLHFEIRRQGRPVDPMQYLPPR